jgi:lysophospholipase L1-like esterase
MKISLCLLALTYSALSSGLAQDSPSQSVNPVAVATPHKEAAGTFDWKLKRVAGKHPDLLFDGDSITNRWEDSGAQAWAQYAKRAANFGIEGDRVENDLWRLDNGQLDGLDPKLVVLLIGTNNVSGGFTPEQIADGIKVLVAEYEKRCPHAHIVLMAIFPRGEAATDPMRLKVAAVNDLIKSLDDGNRVSFVDIGPKLLQTDGKFTPGVVGGDFLHPQAGGYVIWSEALQPLVDKYAPSTSNG